MIKNKNEIRTHKNYSQKGFPKEVRGRELVSCEIIAKFPTPTPPPKFIKGTDFQIQKGHTSQARYGKKNPHLGEL